MKTPTDLQKFFFVVPPQFERLALYELKKNFSARGVELPEYEFFTGGIEMRLPWSVGLSLNRVLKIPTRILWRLDTRETVEWADLKEFLKTIEWKTYFPLRTVYVSSRSSRLKIKDDIKDFFKKQVQFQSSPQGTDVYIRMFRDQCTLSLDTSGDDLFVRGYEKWVGEAPLRDNMASGLLQLSLQGVESLKDWEIVDPMMGSGTFLTEAAHLTDAAPRKFAFQNWKNAPEDLIEWPSSETGRPLLRGSDKAAKVVEMARQNFQKAGVKVSTDIVDAFQSRPVRKKHPRLVIINPPYGKRLSIRERHFFRDLLLSSLENYDPDRLGVLVPRGTRLEAEELERVRFFPFSNNGIDVEFSLFVPKKQKAP